MKNILIIGSNGTIAEEIKKIFISDNLYLASRNVVENSNNIKVDLNNIDDINKLIAKYENINFDYVFINSGIYDEQDYNKNIMVNALSGYYIIKKLSKNLRNCKFILTSSISILRANLNLNPKKKHHIYKNTKYLQLILFDKLKKLDVENDYRIFHPGIVSSNLSLSLHSPFVRFIIKIISNKKHNINELLLMVINNKTNYNMWVSPSKLFCLFGKPKIKEINKEIIYNDEVEKIELKFNEKYR